MFKNYFKTAWRNLRKNKVYSFINIVGLAVGMAVAMLIGFWIYDEVNFNKYHENYERIAQVRRYYTDPSTNETDGTDNMHYPMYTILKSDYKQYFKHVVMAWWVRDYSLSANDKKLTTKKLTIKGEFIDGEGLDMLSLKMIKGTYASLDDLHSIVLSKSTAKAFFGDENPINKRLKIDNSIDVFVTGVYEDIPKNGRWGEVQFFSPWNLFVASNDWIKQTEDSWGNSYNNTSFGIFVQLQPNVSMQTANAAIKDFFYNSVPKEAATEMIKYKEKALLYPMKDWHLYSDFRNGLPDGGRITFVWLFGIVGIFVLLLACINFMNLSTARSGKRAKEVGIRKSIGSLKVQLIYQFLSESFLVVFLAFILSLALVSISLPWFNQLSGKNILIPFSSLFFWLLSLIFIIVTALLAGAYPAFYLSSFQPIKVLKGAFGLGRFAAVPRKALVVIQFTVSVILIIGTVIVYRQIIFAQDRPVGYNRNGLITVARNDPAYEGKLDVIRNELLNTGVVDETAFSLSPLTQIWNTSSDFDWVGKQPREYSFAVDYISYGFGSMVGWQFIAGRDFSKDFPTDTNKVIINETAAKDLGFKDPIGQYIKFGEGTRSKQILGVIKDMVVESPYEPVKREIYFLDAKYEAAAHIDIKIKPTVSSREALPKIEAVFRSIVPSAPFDYKFVDEEYGKKFSQEQLIGKLAALFTFLAILISCLGLFGLASFVAEQRTKEIGIRKVIGASTFSIWNLLSKEFVLLVFISLLIASPIAYYIMNGWIKNYPYHTDIPWWIFIATGVGAVMITLITVSFQSIKAAMANPVKSLRTE
jgi:ABC-type antimicrobial peptide transport system permease subunit